MQMGKKAFWVLGVALWLSAGAIADEFHWATRALDGDWNSPDGKYEISDVDFQDEVATFYFERTRKLDRTWGHHGGRDWDRDRRFSGRDRDRFDPAPSRRARVPRGDRLRACRDPGAR